MFVTQGRFTREYLRGGLAKPEDRQAVIARDPPRPFAALRRKGQLGVKLRKPGAVETQQVFPRQRRWRLTTGTAGECQILP
jgi:hypothetical protein